MHEMTDAYRIMGGKSEGKRPLRRSRRRWEDYIYMGLKGIGERLYTGFIRLRIWNAVINLRVPQKTLYETSD
jgi:hypothetical protein